MLDEFYNNNTPEPPFYEQYQKDPYFIRCSRDLKSFLRRKVTPYYIRQLQVHFEKTYYHWITYNSIYSLIDDGFLTPFRETTNTGSPVIFVIRSSIVTLKKQPIIATHIQTKVKLIEKFSHRSVSDPIGKHLHALLKSELRVNGFSIISEHSSKFGYRAWTKTGENLDIIATHKKGFSIGVEVKNSLDYIPRKELDSKIEMCSYLGLKPFFAVRWMPKTYIYDTYLAGGFAWLFEYQAYPLGLADICGKIKSSFGFPVQVMTELPIRAQALFKSWVDKQT